MGQRSLTIIFVVHKIHDFHKFAKNVKIELLENLELYGMPPEAQALLVAALTKQTMVPHSHSQVAEPSDYPSLHMMQSPPSSPGGMPTFP